MAKVELNRVMLDWITLSSYDKELWAHGYDLIMSYSHRCKIENKKWLQYNGISVVVREAGSIFVGIASQVDSVGQLVDHCILQVSGALADKLLPECYGLLHMVNTGKAKCTRLDGQVTILEPETWSQKALHDELYAARASKIENGQKVKLPSYATSNERGVELATVDNGNRHSDSYVRIYEKLTRDRKKLLRLEVEWKGKQSQRAVMSYIKDRDAIASGLKRRMESVKSDTLNAVFFDALNHVVPEKFIEVTDDTDKRHAWLIGAVLPALRRYLNETGDDSVALEFQLLLGEYHERMGRIDHQDDYGIVW